MKICIAGKNQIAIHGLRLALAALGPAHVMVCPNTGDDGISGWQPSLLKFAREWGIRLVSLSDLYEQEDLLFLSLEFNRLIHPARFKTCRLFNIHFSKLPAYKGMYTAAWPILNGEHHSGVTLHRIDEGIDTGDVIAQLDVDIGEADTARDLYFACMHAAGVLLTEHFSALLDDRYVATPQRAKGGSYYARASIDYSGPLIDLKNTAESVCRQARAFHFRELQIPQVQGFPVHRGQLLAARSRLGAGRVMADGQDALVVSTIDFDVRFERDRSWDFFDFVNASDVIGIRNYAGDKHLVNLSNAKGWTPLIVAAFHGKKEVCRALIEVGADVSQANQNGTTPLMYANAYAARSGDYAVCKLLLDAGCELFACDQFGRTVIDYARFRKERQTLHFFGTAQS